MPHSRSASSLLGTAREVVAFVDRARAAEEVSPAQAAELLTAVVTRLQLAIESTNSRAEDCRRWREADIETIKSNGGFGDTRLTVLIHLLLKEHGDSILSDAGLFRVAELMHVPAS